MQAPILEACLADFFSSGEEGIRKTYDVDLCRFVLALNALVCSREFTKAIKLANTATHEDQRIIRRQFSRNVLASMELEWTGHGVNRTFRFWTEEQKREYLIFSIDVVSALQEKYDTSLGYGSVLSIVRDGDLIPHDDDLDVIVTVPRTSVRSYVITLLELHEFLERKGFRVHGDYLAHRHVSNGRFLIDVFLGLGEEDFVSWHPGPRRRILYDDVFPVKSAKLYGVECPIPAKCNNYLRKVYGENWRTPIPGWTHDFDPKNYRDWFWPEN